MARVVKETQLARRPDEVWAVIGDYEGVPKWLSVITEAKVHDDERICQMGDQGTIRERILSRDDVSMRYEYEIYESPFPLAAYRASMEVQPDSDGSRFVWTIDLHPPEMADALDPVWDAGLEGLRRLLER